MAASADVQRINKAWLSTLARPGNVLRQVGSRDCFFVLQSCRWGVVIWPLQVLKVNADQFYFHLRLDGAPILDH
eukprot:11183310-Lingulodinium_polyedra.AAC.1